MLFLFLFITVAEAQLAYPAPDAGISGSAIPYFTGLKKLTIYRNVDDKWEGRPPFAYIKGAYILSKVDPIVKTNFGQI